MEITLNNGISKKQVVKADIIEINLNGIDYLIYQSPTNLDRLYLDTYSSDPLKAPYYDELTLYNGYLPIRRSIFGWLKNRYSDYKTWLYNVTLNRGATKRQQEKFDKLNP